MKTKFLIFTILVFQTALLILIIVTFALKKDLTRDVFLEGCEHSSETSTDISNEKIHSFAADGLENFALYTTNEKSNNLENASFYGNYDNYSYCDNSNYSIDLWNNDFWNSQIVIKNDISNLNLSVELQNKEELEEIGIEVNYGFAEFIYASGSKLSNGMYNPYGINRTLLVPDKMTSNKALNNAIKNRIYIVYISFKSNDFSKYLSTSNESIKAKFKVFSSNQENLNIFSNILDININALNLSFDNTVSDYNLFHFPEWSSYYYNNGKVPSTILNKNDMNEYIDYNWEKYWKNEFTYMSEMGMNWFQMNISEKWNSNFGEKELNNGWENRRKEMNFIPWQYKGDLNTDNLFGNDIVFEEIVNDLYISDESWATFDKFLNLMVEVGMKRGMLNSINTVWGQNQGGLMIYNDKTKKYFTANSSILDKNGKKFNTWWFEQFKNHIDSKNPDWFDKLDLYFYIDEKDKWTTTQHNNWMKEIDPEKKYLKLAVSDWDRDIDYNYISGYDFVDELWIYFLDVYNEANPNFNKLLNNRNKLGLKTGQYSLDVDNTFNLPKSEPGILGYMQMALLLQGSPSFLKYVITGWQNGNNVWSSDFDDYPWVDLNYISGDTMWAYPKYDHVTQSGQIESDLSVEFLPSIRFEQLKVGTNLTNKFNFLINKGVLNKSDLQSNISRELKKGPKLSNTKFDFNYSDTNFKKNLYFNKSFIEYQLNLSDYDEIQGYKNLINLIKIYSRGELK
ncbi:hypothetical protein [Spiroplasma taiwanense]|uniref:Glycoside hydrolase 123 C-terminal domain-containing protein n=1 Tax=Spiroplasma taiwanense CT-1 TaxID=1276220 RepID=S5LU52_9MOLU|nr:hypothetical protein [Spiroplasma taiwanense]AGR41269.1 hypothetical protein STAIW_v1c06510 [Spiroplasma taiwanense CT-1]